MRCELRGHDRHVDHDQREEHEVGGGHVLARLVRAAARASGSLGRRGRCSRRSGRAGAHCRSSCSSSSRRRSRRSCSDAFLAVSSSFQSVTYSSAIASSDTRNVSRIEPGRLPPVVESTRGWRERLGHPHGHEVERHERPRDDREHRRVAGLAVGVLDREAQRLVAAVEQEDDQERDQRRLVPDPPVAPRRRGPDRAGDEHADRQDDRQVDGHVGAHVPARGRRCAGG